MYNIKSGYAQKGASLPRIHRVIAYFADKTFVVYNHEGEGKYTPVTNTDFSKWEEFAPEKQVHDTVLAASKAKEIVFVKLTAEAQQRNTSGGFEA